MSFHLNANSGFYERYYDTHLQQINPPEADFPSGPFKIYPQCINPPPHTSLSCLCSQSPSPSSSGNTSPSPLSTATTTSEGVRLVSAKQEINQKKDK